MDNGKAAEFYELANEYVRFISKNEISGDSVPSLMELLMKLYSSAMFLTDGEPETIDSCSGTSKSIIVRFSEQISPTYWKIFDPFVDEDSVCGNLIDDLSDIAKELIDGMKEYEAGKIGNAIFEWKFGLNTHWGQHIVDALRALHAIRC